MSVSFFFFSSRRRHTRWTGDWSSDVCSSDLRSARLLQRVRDPAHDAAAERKVGVRHVRSEERRVGKSVDLGGRRIIKKKKKRKREGREYYEDEGGEWGRGDVRKGGEGARRGG